jgi:predicted AlkP superfamily phosphohydrolase/phosphomutase
LLNGLDVNTPRFIAARFPGIDAVGHRFLRYADPSAFGDVTAEESQRFGRVLQQYYGFLDTLVGQEIERLGPNDLLLVVSGFGMEPISPGKRVLELIAGDPLISGTHEPAPDGFILAYGGPVAPGRRPRASLVDLAPTILYFFGLPVGRDMDGFARIDLFKPAFTSDKPVAYIPSYGR